MKPKQIIPTNGNPTTAVAPLTPETISPGTVGVLEWLQGHKEQGTGMSKAAQGLQDELFVSGNSEVKLQQVMSASQKRIQHIARRFAETGMKRLIKGIYKTIKQNMHKMSYSTPEGVYKDIDTVKLPNTMEVDIHLDIGENSNASLQQKLGMLGSQVLPALKEAGADMAIKPEAPAIIATKMVDALGLNPSDFLVDYTTDEYKQKAAEAQQANAAASQKTVELENRQKESAAKLAEEQVKLTKAEANNSYQDNIRQTVTAMDKHYQEWEKLVQEANKEGVTPPEKPDMLAMFEKAKQAVESMTLPSEKEEEEPMMPQGPAQPGPGAPQ